MTVKASRGKLSPMELLKLSDELRVSIQGGAAEVDALRTLQEASNLADFDMTALYKMYRHRDDLKRRIASAIT